MRIERIIKGNNRIKITECTQIKGRTFCKVRIYNCITGFFQCLIFCELTITQKCNTSFNCLIYRKEGIIFRNCKNVSFKLAGVCNALNSRFQYRFKDRCIRRRKLHKICIYLKNAGNLCNCKAFRLCRCCIQKKLFNSCLSLLQVNKVCNLMNSKEVKSALFCTVSNAAFIISHYLFKVCIHIFKCIEVWSRKICSLSALLYAVWNHIYSPYKVTCFCLCGNIRNSNLLCNI